MARTILIHLTTPLISERKFKMGCDIEYYLDHNLIGLSAQEFLEEFKRRVAPLPVVLTGLPEVYPNMDWDKGSPYRHNAILPNCWEIDCFLYDFETQYNSKEDCINIRLHHENIQTTFEEIREYIAPIFHCKKMIAIGDQGLHQELCCAMDAGASIEEVIECKAVKNAGYHVAVYQQGEDKRFSYADKNALPVWMGKV